MLTRREIKTRTRPWAYRLAARLASCGVGPNAVSMASILCAAAAGYGLVNAHFLAAAFFIQLRLLCNMLDGLLAVEEGLFSKTGDLYNEIPDRISDVIILVCAGYAAAEWQVMAIPLGWAAALLAVSTAYVRLLGVALGTKACFSGPMAKPQRMFALTAGCFFGPAGLFVALAVIVAGSIVTCIRRIGFIVKEMTA